MPTKTNHGTGRAPRTLAEKLQWLRDLNTPRGESPPSYDATARQITRETGISISGPYYWELVTGRTTNPKLHHLQAIARFFNVPVGYLSEDEADFERFESRLERLHAITQRGVQNFALPGITDAGADLATVQTLLGRLEMLGLPEEQEVHERLTALSPGQRAFALEILGEAASLEALGAEHLRALLRAAADLRGDQLTVLLSAMRRPDLLDALHEDSVQDIVVRAAALSVTSQRAALALIDQLRHVEEASRIA